MSKHTLKPGYAYVCSSQYEFWDIPNDWWEIQVISKEVCDRCDKIGALLIGDGTDCAVFIDYETNTYIAQTKVTTRDA